MKPIAYLRGGDVRQYLGQSGNTAAAVRGGT